MTPAVLELPPDEVDRSLTGRLKAVAKLLWRDKAAVFGFVIVLLVTLTAIFAPWIAPHDPLKQNLGATELPPAWRTIEQQAFDFGEDGEMITVMEVIEGDPQYLLGTDKLGRDQLSRIIYGARVSVTVGFFGAALATLIGMVLGLVAGYYGGWIDNVIMALVNLLLSIPYLVLVIVVAAVLGRSLFNVIMLFGITASPLFARVTRGEVLRIRRSGYVESAIAVGAKNGRILFDHIMPNLIGPLVTLATFEMSAMIFYEAGLSFLGLSVPPDVPSWGNMLSVGQDLLMANLPWLSVYPGLAIAITSMGMNLFGDWLRDVLDPRLRRTQK